MTLQEFLSQNEKAPKAVTEEALPFTSIEVKSGSLWSGDPYLANDSDGLVVEVPNGRYQLTGVGLQFGRNRLVSKLFVTLEGAQNVEIGPELGENGTDSAAIAVCDLKHFDAVTAHLDGDEIQEAIEAQFEVTGGVIKLEGAEMAYVPTGSDGTGPVYELLSGGKRVGIVLPFMELDDV
jgi:hypothetical protein